MIDLEEAPDDMESFLEAYMEEVPNLTGEGFDTPEDYRIKCPTRIDLERVTDLNYSQVDYRFSLLCEQGCFDIHYEFVGKGTPRNHYYPKEPLRHYVQTQELMHDLFGEVPDTVRYHHLQILVTELHELRKEVRALTIKAGLPPESTGPDFTDEGRGEHKFHWE